MMGGRMRCGRVLKLGEGHRSTVTFMGEVSDGAVIMRWLAVGLLVGLLGCDDSVCVGGGRPAKSLAGGASTNVCARTSSHLMSCHRAPQASIVF